MQYFFPLIGVIITAYLAYYFGVRSYFKQKEYEMVKERYLNESLDIICANLDNSLSEFRDAWGQSFGNLKLFRDLGDNTKIELYNFEINKVTQKSMGIQAFYRLKYLLDNEIFWNTVQMAYAFVIVSLTFIDQDLNAAIKLNLVDDSPIPKEKRLEIFIKYHNELVKMHHESKKYYIVLSYLLNVSQILESERFSFKELKKFRDNEEVIGIVEKIKNLFKDELASKKEIKQFYTE